MCAQRTCTRKLCARFTIIMIKSMQYVFNSIINRIINQIQNLGGFQLYRHPSCLSIITLLMMGKTKRPIIYFLILHLCQNCKNSYINICNLFKNIPIHQALCILFQTWIMVTHHKDVYDNRL